LIRHLRVRLPAFLAFALVAVAVPPAAAQQDRDVTLDVSRQLFSVLYAVRTAGLAPPAGFTDPLSVTARVQSSARQLPPEVVAPLREFFDRQHPQKGPVDLSPYISLALVLGPPPAFEVTLPQDHVPPDAFALQDLLPPLRAFHKDAAVGERWRRLEPFYESAVARHQAEIAQLLLATRGYLRLIQASFPGRMYAIYLEWLVPRGLASARNYGDYYYLVIHPEDNALLRSVRHQYLHFLLDSIAVKFANDIQPLGSLQSIAEKAPRLPKPFRQDTVLLVTECLTRAVELRLQGLDAEDAKTEVNQAEKEGFIFVRHFYQALEGFEQDEPSIRYYFPELLRDFNPEDEVERLAKVAFAPAEQPSTLEPVPPTPAQQVAQLLAEAEASMKDGDFQATGERLRRVLEEFDADEPRALYGMGLLASHQQKSELAKRYFQRTVEAAREPRLLGWAHVYLGRIYDLEGDRQRAMSHYQAALELNTSMARMEQAARNGLERPYGEN
jgi:tetratricopeptide (TPR) repeat protein